MCSVQFLFVQCVILIVYYPFLQEGAVVNISTISRALLDVPFEEVDNVVIVLVSGNTMSAVFAVALAHTIFDFVGNRNFRIADHFIKDIVFVAFADPFDVMLVVGHSYDTGTLGGMLVERLFLFIFFCFIIVFYFPLCSSLFFFYLFLKVCELIRCVPDWAYYDQSKTIIVGAGDVDVLDDAYRGSVGGSGSVVGSGCSTP